MGRAPGGEEVGGRYSGPNSPMIALPGEFRRGFWAPLLPL